MVTTYRYRGYGGPSTPPLTDPRWPALAAPLIEFLEQGPQSWPAIHVWGKQTGYGPNLVRHLIAWAEHHHYAESFYKDEVLYWVGPRASSTRLKVERRQAPVLGELDEGPVHSGLGGGDGEGEGDDDPVVAGVATPKDEFVSGPLDEGDV